MKYTYTITLEDTIVKPERIPSIAIAQRVNKHIKKVDVKKSKNDKWQIIYTINHEAKLWDTDFSLIKFFTIAFINNLEKSVSAMTMYDSEAEDEDLQEKKDD